MCIRGGGKRGRDGHLKRSSREWSSASLTNLPSDRSAGGGEGTEDSVSAASRNSLAFPTLPPTFPASQRSGSREQRTLDGTQESRGDCVARAYHNWLVADHKPLHARLSS